LKPSNYPLVSIVIPVYNGADYVSQAIDSALAQTYPNIEVIVVNDGSNDNGATDAVIKGYGDKVIYLSKPNGGVSSALNLAISHMSGDYFSWLSHDDMYYPTKIEDQVNILKTLNNSKCIILSNSVQIDKNSNVIHRKKYDGFFNEDRFISSQEALKAILKRGSFSGCAFLIPRMVFDEVGLFDERLRYTQDVMMWYKIFIAGYGLYITSKVGVMSRVHEKQLTQTGRKLYYENCAVMAEELIPVFLDISTDEFNYLYYYALHNAKYNNHSIVEKCLSYKKFSPNYVATIKAMQLYGSIRPSIRRMYHLIFNRLRTQ